MKKETKTQKKNAKENKIQKWNEMSRKKWKKRIIKLRGEEDVEVIWVKEEKCIWFNIFFYIFNHDNEDENNFILNMMIEIMMVNKTSCNNKSSDNHNELW